MPHEKINHQHAQNDRQLVVGWDRSGWVQVSIYPQGWVGAAEALVVNTPPDVLDLLIRTLKRARRQAYAGGAVWPGFASVPPVPRVVQ